MLKRREHEAGEQETLMGLIMDEVMDAIVATNEDEQIVLFNKAAEAMFGVSASAVLGQPVDQFIPQRFREAHHQAHREFAQDDHSARHMGVTREVVGLRASGEEFPAEVTISRVEMKGKGKTKRLFTVVLRDVSDRHQAQALLMKE
ncbi:MAG: PAS domain S-box protein, partial [Nitrospira sp.]|nr:PAS domain S-box protein [Nitrospira sp.]